LKEETEEVMKEVLVRDRFNGSIVSQMRRRRRRRYTQDAPARSS
jgi:hypothetical protein